MPSNARCTTTPTGWSKSCSRGRSFRPTSPLEPEENMMAHPIVYGPAISTYVWSARLAVAEKGVTHELVDVPFGAHRAEPHLSRQPFAKVPAFEHDGFALYETQAIMRYVDERFAGTPLQPEDVHEWSRMNQIIGIVDAYAWPSIAQVILFNRILVPR